MTTDTLRYAALALVGVAGAIAGIAAVSSVEAARKPAAPGLRVELPEIRASATNPVPSCVTPDRLNRHLAERNPRLDERFRTIASEYKRHGDALRIRWDYAFYQMILETNSLAYTGDVKARQNNFAGLGATGGGVRGESFPDVSTGVLAHLQHLVAYAGEKVDNPVAQRTREHQDGIVFKSRQLGRAVRYSDLTNRWAMDSRYARSIETLAERFRESACNGPAAVAAVQPPPAAPPAASPPAPAPAAEEQPAARERRRGKDLARSAVDRGRDTAEPKTALGAGGVAAAAATGRDCAVMAASFGGNVTVLIRSETATGVSFTALGVEAASEKAMADSYIGVHAPGGRVAGRFTSRDEAVAHAYSLCDSGKP